MGTRALRGRPEASPDGRVSVARKVTERDVKVLFNLRERPSRELSRAHNASQLTQCAYYRAHHAMGRDSTCELIWRCSIVSHYDLAALFAVCGLRFTPCGSVAQGRPGGRRCFAGLRIAVYALRSVCPWDSSAASHLWFAPWPFVCGGLELHQNACKRHVCGVCGLWRGVCS